MTEYELLLKCLPESDYKRALEGMMVDRNFEFFQPKNGLKDRQISILVNDVTRQLKEKFHLPGMTRQVISGAVFNSLQNQGLRLDK